jgi:protoporphyrinogen oxidase
VCDPADIEDIKYLFVPDSYPVYPLDYREKLKRVWSQLERYENLRSIGRSGSSGTTTWRARCGPASRTAQEHLGTFKG